MPNDTTNTNDHVNTQREADDISPVQRFASAKQAEDNYIELTSYRPDHFTVDPVDYALRGDTNGPDEDLYKTLYRHNRLFEQVKPSAFFAFGVSMRLSAILDNYDGDRLWFCFANPDTATADDFTPEALAAIRGDMNKKEFTRHALRNARSKGLSRLFDRREIKEAAQRFYDDLPTVSDSIDAMKTLERDTRSLSDRLEGLEDSFGPRADWHKLRAEVSAIKLEAAEAITQDDIANEPGLTPDEKADLIAAHEQALEQGLLQDAPEHEREQEAAEQSY